MIPAPRDLVLVVDDDPDIVRFVQVNLEVEGFDVIGARNGFEALRMAIRDRPDLAVIDVMMPGVDGLELTRRLRSNPATSAMPIIMLTAKGQTVDKVIGLTAGADDYVLKPFDTMELVARIRSMLRRTKEIRESSPLTGLPGNNRILQEVQTRAANHEAFAVGHIDIDRFKTVNDAYGFARGDEFIAALAECLQNAADAIPTSPRPFIGHIGGDDFVLVCTPEQVKPLTHHAIHAFLAAADAISDPIDAQRGYLQITDRRGNIRRANLVTISIGVSLSTSREFADPREVLAAASEMKSVAKTQPGSYVAIDRRSVDESDDRPVSPAGSGSIPLPRRGVQPWPDELGPDELGDDWTGPDWTGSDWTDEVDDDWVDAPAPVEPPLPSWAVGARSGSSQSVQSQSVPSQSMPSESVSRRSVPSQSVSPQRASSQPVSAQPGRAQPASAQPASARSIPSESTPRHAEDSRDPAAAPHSAPYSPPSADPPTGTGRAPGRQPPAGAGYGHGPAVGSALGPPRGSPTGPAIGSARVTSRPPVVPNPRQDELDEASRQNERDNGGENNRAWDDREWDDEGDPAPLPPGWRGL
jgi:diguanylate cyclase (GGDEF)-like protein